MKHRKEKAKIEMFAVNAANYELHTSEGGSTVYRSKASANGDVKPHYLCTHCHSDHEISILNPSTDKLTFAGFFVHYCPRCKKEYLMDEVPPMQDIDIPPMKRGRY